MAGWAVQDVNNSATTVISGIVTNQVVGESGWRITSGGATKGLVVKVAVSDVAVVGSIAVKLQTAIGADWVDAKSVSVTVDGNVYIRIMDIADYAVMPLLGRGRITVTTTDAGDEVTITKIDVLQEL